MFANASGAAACDIKDNTFYKTFLKCC